tara:strand:+ start:656 stop:862 length:207 start_codon:yes stop_codon:yes gene_type:complete
MAVEIKELIIQGTVKGTKKATDHDIIGIVKSQISKNSSGSGLKETDKRQLVDECVAAVLKELESKLDY